MRPAVGLVLLLSMGCAPAAVGSSEGEGPAGCYQFRWDAEAAAMRLPWGFELLEGSLQGWPNVPDGRFARTRVTASTTRDHPFAFWSYSEADSIRVGHPGGGGLSLRLTRSGKDLEGSVTASGDAIVLGRETPEVRTAPVLARRVLCPTVAPTPG